jgi:gliding motility-associated protein GldE
MTEKIVVEIISLIVLLFLSAVFSSSETAFTHIDLLKVKNLANSGDKKAKTLERLKEDPERTITTILVGNNLVNISASSVATVLAIEFFGSKGVGVAVGVMTFLILIFGEITPKSYAIRKAESLALFMAPVINILSKIFYPINVTFICISNLFLGKDIKHAPTFTEEEIKTLIDVGKEEGTIEEEEQEMITSIFEFGDTRVKDIMVPRVDMICVEAEETLRDVVGTVTNVGYSRMPIYREKIDNIIGLLYVKDLLEYLKDGNVGITVEKLKREAYFIPETKRADDLLREMQKKRIHMAIVIGEYGGVTGLVTLEDLIEEIVGEIFDEYDVTKEEILYLDKNTAIVDARLPIDELNAEMELDLPNESFDTLAGFMMEYLDKVPEEGEVVKFKDNKFIIERMDEKKISQIRIITSSPSTSSG